MDTTIYLAHIYGPVLLAIGLGVFMSKNYYVRLYHDLQKETLAVLVFAMFTIAGGIAAITAHNTWETLPEIIVSFIGWGLLVKGAMFAIFPKAVDRGGDWTADSKLVPVAGIIMIIIGGYLSWFSYIS